MTKQRVLTFGSIGFFLFGLAMAASINGLCSMESICERPHDDSMAAIFLPFLPLFVFSLITYFLREEIFQSWWRFTRIAIPASIVLILLAPSYSSDWMLPIEKGTVAFFTSLIFVFISVIVIVRAHKQKK